MGRREQAANAKAGIVTDDIKNRKEAKAKPEMACSVCQTVFKVTVKNADAKQHVESKHAGKTFDECFPCAASMVASLSAVENDGKGPKGMAAKAGAANSKKKKDDSAALLMEGLAGATGGKKK